LIEAAFLADGEACGAGEASRPRVLSIGQAAPAAASGRWRGGTPHAQWRRLCVACESPMPAEHVPVRLAGGG
jgi:hypothetical protein